MNQGTMLVDKDNVRWEKSTSADGRDYWVYYRRGYPPLVRRKLLLPRDLGRAYRNDAVCRQRQQPKQFTKWQVEQ